MTEITVYILTETEESPLVTLKKCPVGLFQYQGHLGFKTEGFTMSGGIVMPDAYSVKSGEYFWGNAVSPTERSNLRVLPLNVALDNRPAGARADLVAGDVSHDEHNQPSVTSSSTVPRRGRPKRTEPHPWEVAGIPKSTWLRHEKKKAEGK